MERRPTSPNASVIIDGEYLYHSLKNILTRAPLSTERVDYALLKSYVINSLGYRNATFHYHQREYAAAGPFYSALRHMDYNLHLVPYSVGWEHVKSNITNQILELRYLQSDLLFVGGDSSSGGISDALHSFASSQGTTRNRIHIIHFEEDSEFTEGSYHAHDLVRAVRAAPLHIYAHTHPRSLSGRNVPPAGKLEATNLHASQDQESNSSQPTPTSQPVSSKPTHENPLAEPSGSYPGSISDDFAAYFAARPTEQSILQSFLHAFDLTYASRTQVEGNDIPFYFLRPLPTLAEQFDLDKNILAIDAGGCSHSNEYISSINSILADPFVHEKIDPSRVILIANEPADSHDSNRWQLRFARMGQDTPLLLTFDRDHLRTNQWTTADGLLATITAEFHKKDLFDETQPLNHDEDFFGRQTTIDSLVNAYHERRNKGIFGLRKTGKTSIFKHLERILARERPPGAVHFLDCQSPATYGKRWDTLLSYISQRLASPGDRSSLSQSPSDPVEQFKSAVRHASRDGHLALIFDEIEYITPWAFGRSPLTAHWQEDYIPFWQTIRSTQQELGTFSIMIGGVIPMVAEVGSIAGSPNPLFNLVDAEYVGSMTKDEIGDMVNTLGSKMGMPFTDGAIDYLHQEYGGFPRLTRQACSLIHKMIIQDPYQKFPFEVTEDFLRDTEDDLGEKLSYVSEEILTHLKDFYPAEHSLLEQIAVDDLAGAYPNLRQPDNTHHLRRYGLLKESDHGSKPKIAIPLIEQALQGDTGGSIVAVGLRTSWLSDKISEIDVRLTEFQSIIEAKNANAASEHMLPDIKLLRAGARTNAFYSMEVVVDEVYWRNFISTCQQCFVEPYGGYPSAKAHLEQTYPEVAEALWRISVYRQKDQHLELYPNVREAYERFHRKDLRGLTRSDLGNNYWFALQQRTLDGLALAIMMDIDKHS